MYLLCLDLISHNKYLNGGLKNNNNDNNCSYFLTNTNMHHSVQIS